MRFGIPLAEVHTGKFNLIVVGRQRTSDEMGRTTIRSSISTVSSCSLPENTLQKSTHDGSKCSSASSELPTIIRS
jgi:hypothetical protein